MRTKAEAFLLITSALLLFLLLLPTSVLSSIPPFSCDTSNPSTKDFPFCKETLPIDQRVDDLISRLSLQEKISQLGDIAPAIPRLGLPGYKWWSEALHGVSDTGRGIHFNGSIRTGTSFPQIILTAASFNPLLWYRIAEAIGTEARALYNAGQAEGLTFWAPNINIFRDPRWGRGQETPGEDPLLTSRYAISYVRGVQGDSYQGKGGVGLKASACCKHFTAYDLDRWKGVLRYSFNAKVSVQDLEDTFQPPFKSCVQQGRASAMMCSYNQVNGVPNCGDYNLLTKTARELWGFHGYIASDCGAVSVIYTDQKYTKTPEDAVAITLKAGMDVNCGDYVQTYAYSAIKKGKLQENDINRALRNLFTTRMRLGLFNGSPRHLRFGNIASNQVCSPAHQNLALEAAQDGIVLLKNLENILPLSKAKVSSIGVFGPNANRASMLLGNYNGPPCQSNTPLQVLQKYVKDTRFVAGCDTAICNISDVNEAVRLAKLVDYVILFMGLDQSVEREDFDREELLLPGMQQRLIASVASVAKRPVILVLFCGGPVDVSFVKNDNKIGAVLWGGYPGEAGGLAIAQVIFGEHNPGGRLPLTWYPQKFTRVPMTDMRMRADPATGYPGRTYRFYTGNPVFEFGHGLGYSTFSYKFKSVAQTPLLLNESIAAVQSKSGIISYGISTMSTSECAKLELSALIEVENSGFMDGKHSVLLFLRRASLAGGRARKQLVGFETVRLKAGEKTDVEFVLKPCKDFVHAEEDGRKVVDKGSHFLVVGSEEFQFSIVA